MITDELLALPPDIRWQVVAEIAGDDLVEQHLPQVISDELGTPFGLYADDPHRFIGTVLGGHLWSIQRDVASALIEHRKVAVPAGHDLGKSWLAARIIAWWLSCHRPGEALAVSTAPTFQQVKGILWREIARAHAEGGLPGRLNQTEWWQQTELGPEEMVGYGRKPADSQPGAFQGQHAKFVLVVIDEADEVHPNIWEAVDTIVTNQHSRVLAIGNPVHVASEFAKVTTKRGAAEDWSHDFSDLGWYVIRMDGEQSPNFTGEQIPDGLSDLLLSPEWVEDYARRFGRHSNAFKSRVKGISPSEDADSVVPLSWLQQRCQHLAEPDDSSTGVAGLVPVPAELLWPAAELTPVELGVDVGAGGDETVIWRRRGRRATGRWSTRSRDPRDTHRLVRQALAETPDCSAVKVDVNGVGWGIFGSLLEDYEQGLISPGVQLVPVSVGQTAINPTRFERLRSEIWWEIGRELSEPGIWDLSEVPADVLMQLAEPRYSIRANGLIAVEQKSETKLRIGHSPDDADALLLAFLTLPAERVEQWLVKDAGR